MNIISNRNKILMKNALGFHSASAAFCLALLLSFATLNAQDQNLQTELLVYILPDSLELPTHVRKNVNLQRATVRSSSLKSALQETRALAISRAFPNWPQNDTIITRKDGIKVKAPEFHRIFKLKFASQSEAEAAIRVLEKLPAILFAERQSNPILDNDEFYIDGTQWYLNNDGRNGGVAGADINAEGAWAIFTGDPNTTIAIIDTGVDAGHDDLTGKVTGEAPLGVSHGTLVAGVAAAAGLNGEGIRGVNWNAQILSKRMIDMYGVWLGDEVVSEKIVDAVDENAHILNASWSSPTYSTTIAMAFAYAYKMNRVSIATMGNTGMQQMRYPGGLSNVIAVGGTQNTDLLSPFSTTGSHIDVVAPAGVNPAGLEDARDIFSTAINGYAFTSGTSFAAPQVAGLASLLKGYNNDLSNDDLRQIIRLSADDRGAPGFDNEFGFGRINAGEALQLLQTPNHLFQWSASGGSIISSTGNTAYQFYGAGSLASGQYLVKRHEVRKNVTFPQSFCSIVGVWGRGVSTTGWNHVNPNFGEGFCEVVPGTATNTSATLATYVYEVYNVLGQFVGWHPTSPANVTFAYTVLGIPDSSNASVSGPNTICTSGTFTLNNVPPDASVTWSTNNPNGLNINTSGLATRKNNFDGQVTVTATIDVGCGPSSINRNVWVGKPVYNNIILQVDGNGKLSNCDDTYANTGTIHPGPAMYITAYDWRIPYSNNWYIEEEYGGIADYRYVLIDYYEQNPPYQEAIQIRAYNACGWSYWKEFWVPVDDCAYFSSLAIVPNPVSDQLVIHNNSGDTQIVLYNSAMEVIYKEHKSDDVIQIPIHGFPEGIYHLQVKNAQGTHRERIVIKR